MLQWERTWFPGGAAKVFAVVPYLSGAGSDVAAKFGAEYVIRPAAITVNNFIQRAISLCNADRGDIILLHPGNYTLGSAIIVNRPVTIMGVGGPGAVTIDCATNDCSAFNISSDGVVLRNLYIAEADTGTTNCIGGTGSNALIEDVLIGGGNIASTNATIYLTGDNCIVRRCHLRNVRKGISLEGTNSYALECYVAGSDGTNGNFGIQLTGGASKTGQRVVDNTILMTGATNPVGVNVLAFADYAEVRGNRIMAGGMPASNNKAIVAEADTYAAANLALVATISTTSPAWIDLQAV